MIDPSYELVEAQTHSSFRCVHSSCATFANEHPLHFHPAYELTWILRSTGTRYVGDSVERYKGGDLVLSGPNLPHCWRDDPDPSGVDAPEWITAQFDVTCFGQDFLELAEAAPLRKLLQDSHLGLAFDQSVLTDVGPRLHKLVGLSGLTRLVGLIDILERLTRQTPKSLAASDYHANNTVDRSLVERLEFVQHYILGNLSGEIIQAEISAMLGMRPSAFSKFFRAATGRTFMSLVKLLRINMACRLLATTDKRITAIAFDCGYSHASLFDQHFQSLKGVPPSEYRRRMRALAADPA
ncbi:MAG: AraC family transcriptional regulator [Rhizorhabdus sp.]